MLPSIFLTLGPVKNQALCRTITITHTIFDFCHTCHNKMERMSRYFQILFSIADVRERIRQLIFFSSFPFSPYWNLVIDISHQCNGFFRFIRKGFKPIVIKLHSLPSNLQLICLDCGSYKKSQIKSNKIKVKVKQTSLLKLSRFYLKNLVNVASLATVESFTTHILQNPFPTSSDGLSRQLGTISSSQHTLILHPVSHLANWFWSFLSQC